MHKYKRIILEGCDGSGKSTLGRALAEKLGWSLRDRIVRVGPGQVEGAHILDTQESNMILDRCYFISDMIYEPIATGNKSVFDLDRDRWERELEEDTLIVYVTATETDLIERYRQDGDDIYDIKQILIADQRYHNFFMESKMNHIKIDTSYSGLETNVELILALGGF